MLLCNNKKAFFDYKVETTYEAGISLFGDEVKSLRFGGGNLVDSYVAIDKGEVILWNFRISAYKNSNDKDANDSLRQKKLLLHKDQILKISNKISNKGFALIPLRVYSNRRNLIKVEIALAKGKKTYDKKQAIKEKDLAKQAKREVADSMN